MFEKLSIVAHEDITVRELIHLSKNGHCVSRSSHAGNWSLYKLLLSEVGIPDCIWDVTCVHRDVNNQPRHQLLGGNKIPLLEHQDQLNPADSTKYLTAYHRTLDGNGQTLSSFHVNPLKKMFGDLITTQSRALLQHREKLTRVFEVVQSYCPQLLGRYVLPCGCMVKMENHGSFLTAKCKHNEARVNWNDLAASAIETLVELEKLVFEPHGYIPKGGVLYTFELVVVSFYLWAYWQFGDKTIYELSGPDMIRYATKPEFVQNIQKVLTLLSRYVPELVPQQIEARIVPVTLFRFGYLENCVVSEMVMTTHEAIRKIQGLKRKHLQDDETHASLNSVLKNLLTIINTHGEKWNLFHKPDQDAFFSQHDLDARSGKVKVLDGYLDVPFRTMRYSLEIMQSNERKLTRSLERDSCPYYTVNAFVQ